MRALSVSLPFLFAGVLLIGPGWVNGEQRSKPQNKSGRWLLLAVNENGSNATKSVERTKAVIEKRCRLLGIYCKIERRLSDSPNRLLLRFSTRMALGRVKEILLAEGVEVRPIVSPIFPDLLREYSSRAEAEAAKGTGKEVFPFVDVDGETYLIVERTLILTGNDLRRCGYFRSSENFGKYEVNCLLKPAGSARLRAWTTANIEHYIAVLFNRWVVSAAYVKAPISYDFSVSGGFDKKQAQDLAVIFNSGNLPGSVELLEEGAYRPGVHSASTS